MSTSNKTWLYHRSRTYCGDAQQQATALHSLSQCQPAHSQHHHVPQEAIEVVLAAGQASKSKAQC